MIHFRKQSTVNQSALKISVVSLFNFRCSPWRRTAQILSCTVLLQEWPGTSHSENVSWEFREKKTPYVRTWESTRDQLKIVAGEMKAKEAVHRAITDGLDGLQSCVGLGQVPRNRQQVKDMARRKAVSRGSYPKKMSGAGRTSDPWYMLLNESKIQGRDPKTAFFRDVRVGAEPFCVVGTNRQLDDLKRFCCNPVEYRPLTVDPTFDFGPYNVTPISYQHLIVLRREDGKHPTMIGPVLPHEKKTQSTYSLFGGTLKSLETEESNGFRDR